MTTTFTPTTIPTRPGDPRTKIDRMFAFHPPSSRESWIDANGDGFAIHASGGNGDPNEYPEVFGNGYGMGGTFGRNYPEQDVVEVDTGLRYADMLRVGRTLGNRVSEGLWYRTPTGYSRKAGISGAAPAMSTGATAPEFQQQRYWRTTYADLERVNTVSGAALDRAVARLLDSHDPNFDVTVPAMGLYGVTKSMEQEEARIQRAIQLLGAAPLAPKARQAIFRWLAARPFAKLEGEATDELGRRGTRVVLERINRRTVPAYTVTAQQLRRQWAKQHGVPVPEGQVRGPASLRVPEDDQYRRWYVSVIFDRESGELLQQIAYVRQETTAMRPRFDRDTRAGDGIPWRIRMAVDRQGMSDATLYDVRERTSSITNPRTAACRVTPAMCTTSES